MEVASPAVSSDTSAASVAPMSRRRHHRTRSRRRKRRQARRDATGRGGGRASRRAPRIWALRQPGGFSAAGTAPRDPEGRMRRRSRVPARGSERGFPLSRDVAAEVMEPGRCGPGRRPSSGPRGVVRRRGPTLAVAATSGAEPMSGEPASTGAPSSPRVRPPRVCAPGTRAPPGSRVASAPSGDDLRTRTSAAPAPPALSAPPVTPRSRKRGCRRRATSRRRGRRWARPPSGGAGNPGRARARQRAAGPVWSSAGRAVRPGVGAP